MSCCFSALSYWSGRTEVSEVVLDVNHEVLFDFSVGRHSGNSIYLMVNNRLAARATLGRGFHLCSHDGVSGACARWLHEPMTVECKSWTGRDWNDSVQADGHRWTYFSSLPSNPDAPSRTALSVGASLAPEVCPQIRATHLMLNAAVLKIDELNRVVEILDPQGRSLTGERSLPKIRANEGWRLIFIFVGVVVLSFVVTYFRSSRLNILRL